MTGEITAEKAIAITKLLASSENGGDTAFSLAVDRLYPELRRLAGFQASSAKIASLCATDILHEAYLKLAAHDSTFNNKAHFMAVASKAMRQIIVDYARRKSASKRGGGMQRIDFDDVQIGVNEQASELLLIDQLTMQLEKENSRAARVFECRFFGGMNDRETSDAMGIPLRTVQRDWMKAKAFLGHMWNAENLTN